MSADHFCLKWNNYQSNMVSELDTLRSDEELVDVTLCCDGRQLKAHKVILSACSSYFRNVFKENPCRHPVVILKDVRYDDVEALLSFVYQGVVYISEKKLASFLQTAELLQIRGLTGASTNIKDEPTNQNKAGSEKSSVPPPPQLLTASLINNWKQQQQQSSKSACSSPSKRSVNDPPSPKRRKLLPNRVMINENAESSDTNSTTDISEIESDLPCVQSEVIEGDTRDTNSSCSNEVNDENVKDEAVDYIEDAEIHNVEEDEEDDEEAVEEGEDVVIVKSLPPQISISDNVSNTVLNKIPGISASGAASAAAATVVYNAVSGVQKIKIVTDQSSSNSEHRMGKRPCPLCQKIISNKSNLLKHMRIRHSDEYNPARCGLCGKVFKNKYSLRAHINIYHKEFINPGNVFLSMYATQNQQNPGYGENQPIPFCAVNSMPPSANPSMDPSQMSMPYMNDINYIYSIMKENAPDDTSLK